MGFLLGGSPLHKFIFVNDLQYSEIQIKLNKMFTDSKTPPKIKSYLCHWLPFCGNLGKYFRQPKYLNK